MVGGRAIETSGDLASVVDWLRRLVPDAEIPINASWLELQSFLKDGLILCLLLEAMYPGLCIAKRSSMVGMSNLEKLSVAIDELKLPQLDLADLQEGCRDPVLAWLGNLKAHFKLNMDENSYIQNMWNDFCVNGIKSAADNNNYGGNAIEFSSTNLENASARALFDLINRILDKDIGRRNGHVYDTPYVVKKLVQLLERRVSTQAENIKEHNNYCRKQGDQYQATLRAFESLVGGTSAEIEVLLSRLERIKIEKNNLEENSKVQEQNLKELEKNLNFTSIENSTLRQEVEKLKQNNENHCMQLKKEAEETKDEWKNKVKILESSLNNSKMKIKELESNTESRAKRWRRKESAFKRMIEFQLRSLQELRSSSESIKRVLNKTQQNYAQDFTCLGTKLKSLAYAAENYHSVLAENRRLYNEVQDLKGSIRVYCRIRPFLSGQDPKQTTIEYAGDNGELIVTNPSKPGKDGHRMFKFNKVFNPNATQEEVFLDTRPLIRSILDGYNVCIFAYGQTGSGKTYTMSGPSVSSQESWGVNYRALHDLFELSQSRSAMIAYEIGVQMVEIYNEQVRDLLISNGANRRLGIWTAAQPNGLAVPEATMHRVASTQHVLELMETGLLNRAVGATALNERSSRSHSILTVHVTGTEAKSGSVLRGSLHLVDLAGSERVDRSEATGDRLREAQHINKSLSALGDVIFALAQKSTHVPYRNSKLTQVLQSSLGGQAKTLMFVQLNPDAVSYSETVSTLKFAERVSGVELGAARVNKEGREVKDLMDQVTSLRDVVLRKEREIERLRRPSAYNNCTSLSPSRRSVGSKRSDPGSVGSKRSNPGSVELVGNLLKKSTSMVDLRTGDSDVGSKEDDDVLKFNADSDERLSDISDGNLSMGADTDSSFGGPPELLFLSECAKPVEPLKSPNEERHKGVNVSKLPKPTLKPIATKPSRVSLIRNPKAKASSSTPTSAPARRINISTAAAYKTSKKWH